MSKGDFGRQTAQTLEVFKTYNVSGMEVLNGESNG